MNYTVVWLPAAEADLADLWLNAPDRNAVARAANAIDVTLRRHPNSAGESRADGLRILFVPPLVVFFEVRDADRLVTVRGVARFGQTI